MQVIIFKLIMGFFAKLPLSWSHAIGAGLGRCMAVFNVRLYRTIVKNIQYCYPDATPREQQQLMADGMRETARTITEMGAMWWWPQARLLALATHVSGKAVLDQAMAAGQGVILAAPHLGAWELIGLYCSHHYPMTNLYRPPRLAALDTLVRAARERTGARLVPTDAHGVKKLLRALKKGEMVGVLPDQEPKKGTGVFAPFLHHPAYTMTLLSKLVQRTGAAVIFGFAERLPSGQGYHLRFIPAPQLIHDPAIAVSVAALNQGVEACIQHCPAQYQWSYKRFRIKADTNLNSNPLADDR